MACAYWPPELNIADCCKSDAPIGCTTSYEVATDVPEGEMMGTNTRHVN